MRYLERKGAVKITGVSDFDLAKIFECGQCFRWDSDENGVFTGVARGLAAHLRREGDSVFISGSIEEFETVWRDYFDLDRDYAQIRQGLCIDDFMRKAVEFGAGIRILRQDKWEALCSFILSQCNNIPRIKKIISALCRLFGEQGEFCGDVYHVFPSAGRLAALSPKDLAPIRCGYRAQYVIDAAKQVASGELDLEALSCAEVKDAREALMKLHGVGNKVADCTLLFGLNKLDAFPIDVWMKRAVALHYGKEFDPIVFTPYAGIAQQYMFYYTKFSKNACNQLGGVVELPSVQ